MSRHSSKKAYDQKNKGSRQLEGLRSRIDGNIRAVRSEDFERVQAPFQVRDKVLSVDEAGEEIAKGNCFGLSKRRSRSRSMLQATTPNERPDQDLQLGVQGCGEVDEDSSIVVVFKV